MVAWSDGILAAFAYASTLVATLRAGSRVLYLMEHDQIDVMDGPLILGPKNVVNETEVSPLWDLAYTFQQSVLLALDPDRMEYRVLSVEKQEPEKQEEEPYSLSGFPIRKAIEEESADAEDEPVDEEEAETDDEGDEDDEPVKENDAAEVLEISLVEEKSHDKLADKQYRYLPSFSFPRRFFRRIPGVNRWMGQSDDEDAWVFDEDNAEWDFDFCVSTDVPYNSTDSEQLAEITAYAPGTFSNLRARFGIPEEAFRQSILNSGPYVSFQSNSKGAARAGGVFFFTRDGAYMIKTIKKEEARTLLKMLPKYHKYMRRNGRRSLLTRFCGMYGVSLGSSRSSGSSTDETKLLHHVHKSDEQIFLVMNSVFPAAGSQFITERFDLKGSTVGRECSEEEKEERGKNAILKDLDLAREVELVRSLAQSKTPEYGFHLGPTSKAALLSQLRRDVRLLANCGVMDYSLLVGVVNMDPNHMDGSDMRALEISEIQQSRMEMVRRARQKTSWERAILSSVVAPIRIMSAPPLFFGRRVWSHVDGVLSSILTRPLPYYGADICGVNGGVLSSLEGKRSGNRAIYFLGLIDFLQPWTTRKVIERRLKGILGYDTAAISCVPPDEYAARFLEFIDAHIS